MVLYLLPNLLDETSPTCFLPSITAEIVASLDGLIAESMRGGGRFLKRFSLHLPIELLNEHTDAAHIRALLEPIIQGEKWGLISDAGMPCIADPGAKLVGLARSLRLPIEAIPGPSAILLALMLSGFSAQNFSFHGYLPREQEQLLAKLDKMMQERITHIFIEAPYRNDKLLSILLERLPPKALLSVASNLMLSTQQVRTLPISAWKKEKLSSIDKQPSVFLLC